MCHGPQDTQEDVFEGILPVLEQVVNGQNAVVFMYGVTGSGKTHTMQGTDEDPGLVPRVVQTIFDRRDAMEPEHYMEISCSYVEILKEKLWDLLKERQNTVELKIYSVDGQELVPGMSVVPLDSLDTFLEEYEMATLNRTTAATKLNSASSRSHSILTIYLNTRNRQGHVVRQSKISLCDLAGSENNNLTGNDKDRMVESRAINTSLTTLGTVIKQINKAERHISFRDSKLTRLLSDTLGGTSIGLVLCCLAPGQKFAKDTVNTIKFAGDAKMVTNSVPTSGTGIGRASSMPRTSSTITGTVSRLGAPTRNNNVRAATSTVPRGRKALQANKENVPRDALAAPPRVVRKPLTVNDEIDGRYPPQSNEQVVELQADLAETKGQVGALRAAVDALQAQEEARSQSAAAGKRQPHLIPMTEADMAALPAEDIEARKRALVKAAKQYKNENNLEQARDTYLVLAGYVADHTSKYHEVMDRAAKLNFQLEGTLPITPGPAGIKRSAEESFIPAQAEDQQVRTRLD